jgi:hypothetical protein
MLKAVTQNDSQATGGTFDLMAVYRLSKGVTVVQPFAWKQASLII